MGLFSAIGKIGSGAINLAMTPVEAAREAGEILIDGKSRPRTARRLKRAAQDFSDADDALFDEDYL